MSDEIVKVHPAAERFQMMGADELQALADDIKAHGQLHRVVYFDGQLLDGRNRIAACKLAGVAVKSMTLAECDSPTAYVIGANLRRRQLTDVQCSSLSVDPEIVECHRREAAARKLAGQKAGGGDRRSPDRSLPSATRREAKAASNARVSEAVAASAAAFGVGKDSAYNMQRVRTAAPDVYEAAKRGEFPTVAAAMRAAGLTPRHAGNRDKPASEPPQSGDKPTTKPSASPRSAARAVRDEQVLAKHNEGLGRNEIAAALGCTVSTVAYAKRRLGLVEHDDNPLRGLIDLASETGDMFESAISIAPWASATEEAKEELMAHLRQLQRKTSNIIRRLNNEAATGE